MRRAAVLLIALLLAGVIVWALDPFAADEIPTSLEAMRAATPPTKERPASARLEPLPPPPGLSGDLAASLARVRGLLAEGRREEAATLLAEARERHPDQSERPEVVRLAERTRPPAPPAPARVAEPSPPPRTPSRARTRYARSRAIADLAETPEGRAHLKRHVDRFVPREGGESHAVEAAEASPSDADGEDAVGGIEVAFQRLLRDRPAWRRDAPRLPVADEEAVEARRIDQLERLAERGATELLDPLHGALVWLTLHQDEDGHFSSTTVKARCEALGHGKEGRKRDCLRIFKSADRDDNPVGSTALAVLALLDYRDQDARAVFEPHLGRGVDWLLRQQQKDGTFQANRRDRQYYATALALMALAQAAASTQREDLVLAVERGLVGLYAVVGPKGGYRYGRGAPGDLSVTGWVAQAVEAAQVAGIEIPDRMVLDLRYFLDAAWLGEERFAYLAAQNSGRESLYPVGMLMGHILWDEIDEETATAWRTWLSDHANRTGLDRRIYTLYYGVRVSLLLEGRLADPWKSRVQQLVEKQVKTGDAAGMFPRAIGRWAREPVLATALAALTLEHALYER